MVKTKTAAFCSVFLSLLFSAPVQAHSKDWNTGHGITIGSLLGGVVGYQIARDDGVLAGSLLGALAGSRYSRNGGTRNHSHGHSRLAAADRSSAVRERLQRRITLETSSEILASDELFEVESAILTQSGKRQLDAIARLLAKHSRTRVTIDGYTDLREQPYPNRILSLSQAQAVALYLVVNGVERDRLLARGLGQSSMTPAATAATAEQDQKPPVPGRRVELFIEPVFDNEDLR